MKKRVLVMALVAMMLLVLVAACGASESPYVGSWNATKYEAYGIELGVEDIGESTMEFKSDGTMTVDLLGETGSGNWEETENGLKIIDDTDELELTFSDDVLVLEYDGVKMYFQKDS